MQLHPERGELLDNGESREKSFYIRGEKREIIIHPRRAEKNHFTSGERKGKSCYIRGEKREIMLHPEREKGASGEGKREIKLHPLREKENHVTFRDNAMLSSVSKM